MTEIGFNILILVLLLIGWAAFFLIILKFTRPKNSAVSRNNPLLLHTKPETKMPGQLAAQSSEGVLLAIEVPKENEITPLAAELMFASLHGIYRKDFEKAKAPQEHISFEFYAKEKLIRFLVWVPKHLQGYVEGQIYAQYPGVNVYEMKDYADPTKVPSGMAMAGAYLKLNREDIFPIKSFITFEVDPLAAITSTLSKLEGESQLWIQIIIRPENDLWRDRAIKYISAIKAGKKDFATTLVRSLTGLAGDVMKTAISGSQSLSHGEEHKIELDPGVDLALKEIEAKSSKLGFQTMIRIIALDPNPVSAQQKLDLVVGTFKQFNSTNLNGFDAMPIVPLSRETLNQYERRAFSQPGYVLNVAELASIFHLPSLSVTTPNIVWAGAKKGEPPANLPLADEIPAAELTILGETNFRGSQEKFGIKIKDRRRHIYVIGKSGVGKSVLLENMTMDDINEGRGVAVIDPHGDYVDYVLERIPDNRIEDVIIFDPNDKDYPLAFNILEVEDPKYKVITASGVVGVFKKIFAESWGPRLEYWLSSAILALLDYPNATLMMVPQLFVDRDFRDKVINAIDDPVIKSRWINEYNKLDQKQQSETISPILNKVGQFLSTSIIRDIVGQPRSSIKMREVMDDGKILLVKLTKGLIGEDSAALLGALMVTKIQLAAMSRADIADATQRRDFFLYVDEFQNFATDAFATILSEARKYGLCLTMAHQYIAQLSETVSKAIFGNVGTLVSFRVGAEDGGFLKQEFLPVFDEQDLVNLNIYNIYLKLSVDGLTAQAFSATTLPPNAEQTNNYAKVVEQSRRKYAMHVDQVHQEMRTNNPVSTPPPPAQPRPRYSGPPAQAPAPSRQPNRAAPPASNIPIRNDRPAPRPAGQRASAPDMLKSLISKIEKTRPTKLKPEEKEDVAKTLMDDMKNETTSFADAFKKANEQQNPPDVRPPRPE